MPARVGPVRRAVTRWADPARIAVARWARGPVGRLALPGLLIAALVGITGAAGYLVPAMSPAVPVQVAAEPTHSTPATEPTTAAPVPPPPPPTHIPVPPGAAGREADKLSGWAAPLSVRLQIPQTAMEAYGYAQWVIEQTQPNCRLGWTTLAAIGKVESDHGRAKGATLTPDGRAFPPIVGDPLDGQGGRRLIRDTDNGELDNDGVYDRAIGPMQFIPSTWRSWATDADSDGVRDPHDIDDAALAAAKYLCAGGRDLATAAGWREAILAYNNVPSYADQVFETANRYGQQSRDTQ
jgi:hypothetical protein